MAPEVFGNVNHVPLDPHAGAWASQLHLALQSSCSQTHLNRPFLLKWNWHEVLLYSIIITDKLDKPPVKLWFKKNPGIEVSLVKEE